MNGSASFGGHLKTRLLKAPTIHNARGVRVPGGRLLFTRDKGTGILSESQFTSNLTMVHRDSTGEVLDIIDAGSGNVQQSFVVALFADVLGTTTNLGAPVLNKSGKYMYSGTGSTVTTYDYQLATAAGPASGLLTPTLGISGNNSTLQYVGTISYTSTLAITEWGLFNVNSQGAAYSASSFSSVTTTTVTPTTNPAWTTNQWAGYMAVDTSAATKVAGYIISNTATALTLASLGTSAWAQLNATGGTGSTPATTDTLGIYPLMTDHKSFAAINVNNGDSIQYTYSLTAQSGG